MSRGEIAVVHNGIIENYEELRAELKAKGYRLRQPDRHRGHRPPGPQPLRRRPARRRCARAVKRLTGAYAIAVVAKSEPGTRGRRARRQPAGGRRRRRARTSSPRTRWRSPAPPTASPTWRRATSPRSASTAIACSTPPTAQARRELRTVKTAGATVELGPYRHYMQKEIFEQPRAVADTLEGVESITPALFGAGARARAARRRRRCWCSPAAPATTPAWWRSTGSKASPACRRRSRSRASTATATACPIPRRWWWWSRSPARPPTRSRRCATPSRSARSARSRSATSPPARMMRETRLQFLTHAGRRDRRRLDQGVHHPAGGAVPARADAGEAARGDCRGRGAGAPARRCATCRRRSARRSRSSRSSSPGRSASRRRSTRCSSAAACTTRSRSKARSS